MSKKKSAESGAFGKIFNYLAALALTVVFALYLSGRTGWFFFTVMIAVPVISAVSAAVMRNFIDVTADISENRLYKNEKTVLRITVKNRSFIPAPPVYAELDSSDALFCDEDRRICDISVFPRSEQTAVIPYTAKMWYPSEIVINKLYIKDYMGVFRFKLNTCPALSFGVDIMPDIAEIPAAGELIKSVNEAAKGDDSEETRDVRAVGFTGTPGFEHREYFPGDPVKRINWKLSCKRNILMIRLDDESAASKHTFILDRVNRQGNPKCGEICGETMLGTLTAVIRTGYQAELWYYKKGWQCEGIDDENDIEQLRVKLAGYRFSEKPEPDRVPYTEMEERGGKKSASLLLFTPCLDKELSGYIKTGERTSKTDTAVLAAAASVEKGADSSGIWLISEGGETQFIQ